MGGGRERRGEGDVSARSACSTCCQPFPHQVRGMQLEWASSQGSSTVRFNKDRRSHSASTTCPRGRSATRRCSGVGRAGRVVFEAFCACTFITYLHSSARRTSFCASDFVFTPSLQQLRFCWPLCWTRVPGTLTPTHPSASHRSFFTCLFSGNDGMFVAVAGTLARHLVRSSYFLLRLYPMDRRRSISLRPPSAVVAHMLSSRASEKVQVLVACVQEFSINEVPCE